MHRLRRICFALAIALGLSLATTAGASASPASAAACHAEGTRLMKAGEGRVYLIGPGGTLYWIPSETVYNDLWGGWDGIITVPAGIFNTCYTTPSTPLYNAHFEKGKQTSEVYIYNWSAGGLQKIKDWATFTTKYHFDPAAIYEVPEPVIHTGSIWS